VLLSRRGPAEASFTTPELKELGELAGADVLVDPAELVLDRFSEASLEANTNARRNVEVLREYAARKPQGKPKSIRLRFCVSPTAILGDERVEGVEIVRNELVARDGRVVAVPTDDKETIPCGLVFRSIGYHGIPLPDLPFDARAGTIPNDGGRILDGDGAPLRGAYVAGWIKRGPTGVIGTNKKDATETVALLLEDARSGRLPRVDAGEDAIVELLVQRGAKPVVYAGWEAIDTLERSRGEPLGRPRVKLCSWDELLAAARS
jgi:ferredoxin--NADP+ reductase